MKMYAIVLTFFAIILACSAAGTEFDEKTKQKIKEICKQTADTNFCSSIFTNNLKTPSPTNQDFINATVHESERFIENTYFYISQLLRNAGEERPKLQMCAEAYSIADMASMRAVVYFDTGDYSKIISVQDRIVMGLDLCKTDVEIPGYKINPLIEKKRNTMILVTVAKIVAHLVSL